MDHSSSVGSLDPLGDVHPSHVLDGGRQAGHHLQHLHSHRLVTLTVTVTVTIFNIWTVQVSAAQYSAVQCSSSVQLSVDLSSEFAGSHGPIPGRHHRHLGGHWRCKVVVIMALII